MEPVTKYYEEEDDLMPRLRPLVLPEKICLQFNRVLDKKWKKALSESGHVKPANELLEALMSSASGRVTLYYVADLMHKLGLSVSYELFKHETGFDLFELSLRHQMEEQMQYVCRPGYVEAEPQIIYKLGDFVNGQSFYNKNPEMCYDRDVVGEIWDDLELWPAFECNKRPTRRGRKQYEEFFLSRMAVVANGLATPQRRGQRVNNNCNNNNNRLRGGMKK